MDNSTGGGFQREMVQGSWECSVCKKEITELPFAPRGNSPLFCKDCYRNNKPQKSSYGGGGQSGSRPMVSGSWQCADCGKEITSLPFQPNSGQPISCLDCYRNKKSQ